MLAVGWYEALTPLHRALVDAAVRMNGGGAERDLSREAASRGESGRYGDAAHFAKGVRALEARGIFRRGMVARREWWLTEEAWQGLGLDGPAPGTSQTGLFG